MGEREPDASESSSTDRSERSTAEDENFLALKQVPERRARTMPLGLSMRADRALTIGGVGLIVLLAVGWAWSVAHAREYSSSSNGEVDSPTRTIAAALMNGNAPSAAYITGAAIDVLTNHILASQLGKSGRVRATFQMSGGIRPDTLPPGATVKYVSGADTTTQPTHSGVWGLLLSIGNVIRPIADFSVITMLPFSAKQRGRIGNYFIGNWPGERGSKAPSKAPSGGYANPTGFIEVTQQNENTPVSDHFKLGDFLTHDQPNVWPKYMVLSPKLIDKLELILEDLEAHGINTKGVKVMSGFRTPQYNATGGETNGRAEQSRHMFGDASDIYIDNDGNGVMDDLNHDGRIDINDSRVILAAEDRVERAHPELIGGGGVYSAAPGHGPFIHIDTRGYRARW